MKAQVKANLLKILAAILVLSMVTLGLAIHDAGTLKNYYDAGAAISAKPTLGVSGTTKFQHHHAIPRDQYSSHGGEDGSGGSGGDPTKN
ncbi:hypothetical protein ACQ4PT_035666 [Festuca glaucescens]